LTNVPGFEIETVSPKELTMAADAKKTDKKSDYQGRIHNLQKDMIGRYYDSLTAAA